MVKGLDVYGIGNLREVVNFLQGFTNLIPARINLDETFTEAQRSFDGDFCDVKGQAQVKRALEVAAAGGHNVLMIGPPGSGKTMLARRMPSIMPPLTLQEALETTRIHSVAGKMGYRQGLLTVRPFRTPHHLTSQVALVGGGANPQPGEISLAHNGILFLDELPEFSRNALESLRQPMEEKQIVVSRAKYTARYPANFMLIASMNPCPCGYYNHPTRECVCSPGSVGKYLNHISGPMLDRIDLHIEVTPVPFADLTHNRPEEDSATIRKRVVAARKIQQARFDGMPVHSNAMMGSSQLREFCPLNTESARLLETAMERLNLSARAYDRIIKVARTIRRPRPKRSHPFQPHRRSHSLPQPRPGIVGRLAPQRHATPGQNRPLSVRANYRTARSWHYPFFPGNGPVVARHCHHRRGVRCGMAAAGNRCGLAGMKWPRFSSPEC